MFKKIKRRIMLCVLTVIVLSSLKSTTRVFAATTWQYNSTTWNLVWKESSFQKVYIDGELSGALEFKNSSSVIVGEIRLKAGILTSKQRLLVTNYGDDYGKYAYAQKLIWEADVQPKSCLNGLYNGTWRRVYVETNAQAYGSELQKSGPVVQMKRVYLMRDKDILPTADTPQDYNIETSQTFDYGTSSSVAAETNVKGESGRSFGVSIGSKLTYVIDNETISSSAGGDSGEAYWRFTVRSNDGDSNNLTYMMSGNNKFTGELSWHLPSETFSKEANPGVITGYNPYAPALKKGAYRSWLTGYTVGLTVDFGFVNASKLYQYSLKKPLDAYGDDLAVGRETVVITVN